MIRGEHHEHRYVHRRLAKSAFSCHRGGLVVISTPLSHLPDIASGQVPTLAPLVREVTPSVVNISVHGRVKEENPLYRDPLFREFFDVPKQLEREFQAAGSGVIVDAQHGYILTANHVVAQVATAQVTTKDGRHFVAKLVGRDPGTDVAVPSNERGHWPASNPNGR
jgi:serine protease Do